MIIYEKDTKLSKDAKNLIDFFNKVAEDLKYPNCEGRADRERILLKAEKDLIMWGKL